MTDAWGNFFAALVGASAALLGLLFVGVSLNLSQVLKWRGLASRALVAMLLLLIVMIVSLIFLLPGVGLRALGVLVTGIGLATVVGGTVIEASIPRSTAVPRYTQALNFLLFEISAIPYVAGGILLFLGETSGAYWVAAATILSTVKAVVDAWVLLVEINR